MFSFIQKYLSNIFTDADNSTFSSSKLVGVSASIVASYSFIKVGSVDFAGFCAGQAALIAALAAKKYVETRNDTTTN